VTRAVHVNSSDPKGIHHTIAHTLRIHGCDCTPDQVWTEVSPHLLQCHVHHQDHCSAHARAAQPDAN